VVELVRTKSIGGEQGSFRGYKYTDTKSDYKKSKEFIQGFQ
jgi:hypothetical protein